MICTRSMQLLVKRTTTQFKTLEGLLVIYNHNEKTTISTKTGELDTQIPFYLGVSKSILEYVIFCHQEESLWPLSEASQLKKRFDEIFEALKFTKALESIKNIRKNMAIEIKLLEQNVSHMKNDVNKAQEAKQKKEALMLQIDQFKEDSRKLDENIKRVNLELAQLFKSNQEFQQVIAKIENLNFSKMTYTKQIDNLEKTIEYLHESEEVLQEKLANFSEQVSELQDQIDAKELELDQDIEELSELREQLGKKMGQQGELKSIKKTYESNLERRKQLFEKNKKQMGSNSLENFSKDLLAYLELERKQFNDFCEEKDSTLKESQTKIASLQESILNQENFQKYTNDDIKRLEKETSQLEKKIKENSDNDIESEKSQLKSLEKKLQSVKNSNEISETIEKLKKNELEISEIEQKIEKSNEEIAKASKRSDSNAMLSILKQNIEQKKQSVDRILKQHSDEFKETLGVSMTECLNSISIFNEVFEGEEDRHGKTKLEHQNSQKMKSQFDTELRLQRDEFEQKQNDLKSLKSKISSVLPSDVLLDEYEEYLSELEQDYKVALQNAKLKQTTKEFNVKALEIAEKDHFCVLCRRGFNENEMEKFIKLMQNLTSKINVDDNAEVIECEEELNVARSVSSSVSQVKKLTSELPNIECKISELEAARKDIEDKIFQNEIKLQSETEKLEKMRIFENQLSDMTRYTKEIEGITFEIEGITNQLSDFGASKSLEELQEEQLSLSNQFKFLRQMNKSLNDRKEFQVKEINRMESQLKDKQLRIQETEMRLAEVENLKKRFGTNKARITELKDTSKSISEKLNKLVLGKKSLEKQRNEDMETLGKKYTEMDSRLKNTVSIHDELTQLNKMIKKFESVDQPSIVLVNEEVRDLHDKISLLEQRVNDQTKTINKMKKDMNNQDQVQKNIRDNLQLRDLNRQLDSLEEEILRLEAQNAQAEKDKFDADTYKLQQKLAELQADYGGKLGEIKQMERQTVQLDAELSTHYRDIEKVYHKEWVTLQTQNLMNDDLLKYSKALDSGIMKFHSIKMQEINKVIDELWHATYRGTDIDTVQIKSEAQKASGSAQSRTYNYRVVMKKSDVELDMRGRCSAGQKVLASIIIRLALAECFGINCGMIALDEPTTNLDTENSESLAQSLGRIIELRKNQKNFQLIVITHDEQFLSHMNAGKYTDHFYKVSRNDRQKSEIEWVSIGKINEV